MKSVIPFLQKLKRNNNRDWFEKNRPAYEQARTEFIDFVAGVLDRVEKKDREISGLEPSKCVFRIYRDIRFSNDKTPYKKHLGADMGPGGRKANRPGYYIHVEPGNSFLCAGMWMPEPEDLQKLRMEIDYNFDEFNKLLKEKKFKQLYGGLSEEDKGKLPPKGYAKENPAIEFLKLKSFIVVHEFDEADLLKKNAAQKAGDILLSALPLNSFLRRALD